jgi:hypothetical protein
MDFFPQEFSLKTPSKLAECDGQSAVDAPQHAHMGISFASLSVWFMAALDVCLLLH